MAATEGWLTACRDAGLREGKILEKVEPFGLPEKHQG